MVKGLHPGVVGETGLSSVTPSSYLFIVNVPDMGHFPFFIHGPPSIQRSLPPDQPKQYDQVQQEAKMSQKFAPN